LSFTVCKTPTKKLTKIGSIKTKNKNLTTEKRWLATLLAIKKFFSCQVKSSLNLVKVTTT